MKKLMKKIRNSVLTDWKKMNSTHRVLFILTVLSPIATIFSLIFFKEIFPLMAIGSLIILTLYLLVTLGAIFISATKKIIQESQTERPFPNKNQKRLWLSGVRLLETMKPKLNELEEELKKIDAMDNKVEAIVRLFQIISPLQDTGGFSQEIFELKKYNCNDKFNTQIKAIEVLQEHFQNAGRSAYGINRTTRGEEITNEKVFLGNLFGLHTKTADYWLSEKSKLEKNFRRDISKNPEQPISEWYIINDHQCGNFVKSHTDGIIKQIQMLKSVA